MLPAALLILDDRILLLQTVAVIKPKPVRIESKEWHEEEEKECVFKWYPQRHVSIYYYFISELLCHHCGHRSNQYLLQ